MDWNTLNKDNFNKKFKLKEYHVATSSSWISYDSEKNERVKPLYALEAYQADPMLIIQEFGEMDEEQKNKILPFLKEWLTDANVSAIDQDSGQVRDFIYEMF
ncbi:MAG: hypothetical protein ABJO02_03650 [Reichenbachiella sp.]|uniref:hypothetical protein n=1 Tax=Reichenbachiella sp. TaxID=2184521 RepID=UPI003299EE3E